MGYTTEFCGKFTLDRQLSPEHAEYLRAFAGTRRMKRNEARASLLPDPVREAAGLPVGPDGGYFVGGEDLGQAETPDIVEYNGPPAGQPGLWCQWVPTEDDRGVEWDGGEKFYNYVEWLRYLVGNFLAPWGYVLSGEVSWQGEDHDDRGVIVARDGEVLPGVADVEAEAATLKTQMADMRSYLDEQLARARSLVASCERHAQSYWEGHVNAFECAIRKHDEITRSRDEDEAV